LTAFFVKAVFTPIAWILGLVFNSLIVPSYRLYSRLTRQAAASPRTIYGFTDIASSRYTIHVIVLVVAGILVFYNFNNSGAVLSANELVGKTYLARLSTENPSDFDQPIEEYPNLDIARWTRPHIEPVARLEAPETIYTNEAPAEEETPSETPGGSVARTEAITYTVQNGDAISTIARRFGISVNTLLWENNLSATSLIKPGDKLTVLPSSGVSHTVASGQTLGQIAALYGVDAQKIMDSNNLSDPNQLRIGAKLVIPGGNKIIAQAPSTPNNRPTTGIANSIKKFINPGSSSAVVPAGGRMAWPTTGHRITQYFSYRHTGVDIADHIGTPIYAAEDGVVTTAGWNSGGYGNMILIDHGGGKKTRYGHLSAFAVNKGQRVKKGQYIAAMGSTGHSTGPHLHFEVIINGRVYNPLNYTR
jgi:murein DD-endopeptidase MepM/ murein hydrolase activator NlpD